MRDFDGVAVLVEILLGHLHPREEVDDPRADGDALQRNREAPLAVRVEAEEAQLVVTHVLVLMVVVRVVLAAEAPARRIATIGADALLLTPAAMVLHRSRFVTALLGLSAGLLLLIAATAVHL